jgi:hypothetical protein
MMRRAGTILLLIATVLAGNASPASAQTRVTADWLKSLKTTSSDPSGDAFIGSPVELTRAVDAIIADPSMVSPMYLFFAAKTAFNLSRLEDAAFLFYAAQLRAAFDFSRFDIANAPDGNNAATYLGFQRRTIGNSVSPAIMLKPATFATVMDRLERWTLVPSPQAYYPDFADAKGFKAPAEKWASMAAALKGRFMVEFGRRQARLLKDGQYFAAFQFVQAMNQGLISDTPQNRERFQKENEAMLAAEKRLFPPAK